MSEAPERIYAAPPSDDREWKSGAGEWDASRYWTADGATEYVRADRIEELEAKLAKATPNDGRPCNTDEFLVVLLNEVEDKWDILDAIKSWIEGAWDEAVEGTTLAELTGGKDE